MQPFTIAGSDAGLQTNKKPSLLPDKAFPVLENAYVWRDRVVKRKGLELLGRLRRTFSNINFFPFGASPFTHNLAVVNGYVANADNANPGNVTTTYPHGLSNGDFVIFTGITGAVGYNNQIFIITVVDDFNFTIGVNAGAFGAYTGGGSWISTHPISSTEPNSSIEPGSVTVVIHAGPDITFQDQGDGTLTSLTPGNSGTINYINGNITLTHTAGLALTSISYNYFPDFPVMGIWQREIPAINDEETVFFDTKYAYKFVGSDFQEFAPGTAWFGSDADFFWATNWRGSTADSRLFFVTNFVNDSNDPIRYTSGGAWTDFAPYVSRNNPPDPLIDIKLYQARILIPYYGRLLALNTWEGTETGGYAGAVNFFARCRYSQIGDPTAADAWRSDQFGKGGFIDAPTSEQITSAIFFKNTLIVFFERTTWQLRYVGDYGIPFIWERISSDFGSESTFSTILFDQGVAAVGDRAIISSTAISADRIDLAIPDFVFEFRNSLNGPERVIGVRDFRNEIVYWCYNDFNSDSTNQKFPNHVLVYNYRNNTYSIFRDNVTFFGTFQSSTSVTWDSETILWDDEGVTWDDPANQSLYPSIVSGNQQGFVHYYNRNTPDESSLYISAVDLTTTPIRLTIPNHNLDDGDTIYLTGLAFVDPSFIPVDSSLNDSIFRAVYIDDNTIGLMQWQFSTQEYINNFTFTPPNTSTYIGAGTVALFPKLDVQTKDFNPYLNMGSQAKLSYVDFLTDATPSAVMTVNLYANTQVGDPVVRANILVGNRESETYLTAPYYSTPTSDIAWHRFYCTLAAQFIRLQFTYDDDLMNTLTTHQQTWVLNAITLWTRPGGKLIF